MFVASCFFLVVRSLLRVEGCLWLVACCWSFVAGLIVGCCLLFVVCYLLFVVCGFVVSRVLFDGCCLLFVLW